MNTWGDLLKLTYVRYNIARKGNISNQMFEKRVQEGFLPYRISKGELPWRRGVGILLIMNIAVEEPQSRVEKEHGNGMALWGQLQSYAYAYVLLFHYCVGVYGNEICCCVL